MIKDRKSRLVILGRFLQSIPPVFFTWIEFLCNKRNIKQYPFIILVSAPRSGSTLTYQILSRATSSMYLTNLWNLLYSVPIIGGKISRNKRSNSNNFISNKGLVQGVYGESEGLKFWEYWTGQGLEETNHKLPIRRVKYLRKVFGGLLRKDVPMITAYLGHAFSINNLRKIFPGSIFIYLKRDQLSNIYSMMRTYREFEKNRKNFNWLSLKPIGWRNKIHEPLIHKIIWQYNSIITKIESEISDDDTLTVSYQDICNDPRNFLNNVKMFALRHNIDMNLNLDNIPESFKVSKVNADLDEDSKMIYNLLRNE